MDTDASANFSNSEVNENCSTLEFNSSCIQNFTIFEAVIAALNYYYTPFLIIIGCLGNLLSLFVFYNSKLRLQSTSVYLSSLALSDTLFLLQLLPPWLQSNQFSNIFHKAGFCQFIVYVSYVSCFYSTWTVVAFTVERFVAVLYPLQRGLICTVNRPKYIAVVLLLAALIINIPVLRFTTPSMNECNVDSQYLDTAARFNLVDTAIAFTVPLGAIVLLNVRIMIEVCKLERARHKLLKVAERKTNRARITQTAGVRSQTRVTRMLLLVSSVFVILNLPAYTMRILAYAYDMDRELLGERWPAYQQLALAFFNTNFGINFMLYCLSGQNFRRALCHTIPWLRRPAIRSAAARRTACNPARASSISTSYASAATEGANTTSLALACMDEAAAVRRHRPDPVLKRWTFDNSRQRTRTEVPPTEMETFNLGNCSATTERTI